MLRLFTTLYPERNPQRLAEYVECLQRNLANSLVDEVCILAEGEGLVFPESSKLRLRRIAQRPLYNDFFDWIREIAGPDDMSAIANTDIWLDQGIRIVGAMNWGSPMVLALSRWDQLPGRKIRIFDRGDSQDCWILKGPVRDVKGDFPLGVYDCDNKIAWEFEQAGYRVRNPSLGLRTYHLHLGSLRSYDPHDPADHGIRPPFRYIEPENSFGPFKAFIVMLRYNPGYYPWSMTWGRFWRYRWPALFMRIWNRFLREWK